MKFIFHKKKVFILFLAVCHSALYSQFNLSGNIRDTANKPIASASVTLTKKNSTLIETYFITTNAGQFNLQYAGKLTDSFYVHVNAMGFAAQRQLVTATNQSFQFILKSAISMLPNVSVKNNKLFLKLRGDTLNYSVDSFKNKQDRTIGDVLKKMPGIDVDDKGKISYNGKPISNFYIDGDNLLDDKYNLATNSIGADMVDKVQVLEKHQPIKVLRDATISDKVALNLSLKDKARLKLTGRSELGAGFTDDNIIYDETMNVMAFKKKYKAINSFKANNSGIDVSDDILSHNLSDNLRQLENDDPKSLLSTNASGYPSINKQRYIFNNAAILNTNNLFKTKNDVQLRTNIYYLNDFQSQDFESTSIYYLPNDTVKYITKQHAATNFNNLHAQLNINDNKQNHYLNNTLVMDVSNQPSSSNLTSNGTNLSQSLSEKINNFSNEFNFIKTIHSKNIVEANSYFNHVTKPEILQIQPGINADVFNNNHQFASISQDAKLPTYFTNNYVSYRHPAKHILQTYKLGMTGQWQQLQSSLLITQLNSSSAIVSDSFTNYLEWQHYKVYAQADYDWITDRTQLSLSLPYNWQNFSYQDTVLHQSNNLNHFFFNPSIRIKYQTGQENFITARYEFTNKIGSIENIYPGYILRNYTTLENNNIPFVESNTQNISVGFNFRKSIKVLFFNVLTSYSVTNNNSISTTTFFSNLQKQTTIPFNNTTNSFKLFSGISKYIFALHSTISLKASFEKAKWNQLQNNILLNYLNTNGSITAGLHSKIASWLNADYSATISSSKSENITPFQNSVNQNQIINQAQQQMEVNIFPINIFLSS